MTENRLPQPETSDRLRAHLDRAALALKNLRADLSVLNSGGTPPPSGSQAPAAPPLPDLTDECALAVAMSDVAAAAREVETLERLIAQRLTQLRQEPDGRVASAARPLTPARTPRVARRALAVAG